jgi:hypothetical protein
VSARADSADELDLHFQTLASLRSSAPAAPLLVVDDRSPAVAGGAVVEEDGLIRQAGYFFSAFRRSWSARLRRVPLELLAVSDPLRCPVSAELQLMRHDWIGRIGAYDEELSGAQASLDYCLRAYAAGADCVLEPTVWARALESRDGEPETGTPEAFRLRSLHAGVNFARWTPEVV